MLPNLQGFLRGLHRELLAHTGHNAQFQTAGGIKTSVDTSVAYVMVNFGEGPAIVSTYETTTVAALNELVAALARSGVEIDSVAEVRRSLEACTSDQTTMLQPYERTLRLASVAARCAVLARRMPREWADGVALVERLSAAEEKFGIDWSAAVARQVAVLNFDCASPQAQEVRADALQSYFRTLYADRPGLCVHALALLPGAHSREVYFLIWSTRPAGVSRWCCGGIANRMRSRPPSPRSDRSWRPCGSKVFRCLRSWRPARIDPCLAGHFSSCAKFLGRSSRNAPT